MTGEELPRFRPAWRRQHRRIHQELSRYRYCTVFVVEGEWIDAASLETELERLGDSLMVVGDETALKVHVHTDDPGAALSLGAARGVLEGIEIANMHHQTERRRTRLRLATVPQASEPSRSSRGRGTSGSFAASARRRSSRAASR